MIDGSVDGGVGEGKQLPEGHTACHEAAVPSVAVTASGTRLLDGYSPSAFLRISDIMV